MKKKLKEMIEVNGLGMDWLNENDVFTFTSCDMKEYQKIKKVIDKTEIDYNEEFEVDGGDPYFMIVVNSDKLKEYIS